MISLDHIEDAEDGRKSEILVSDEPFEIMSCVSLAGTKLFALTLTDEIIAAIKPLIINRE